MNRNEAKRIFIEYSGLSEKDIVELEHIPLGYSNHIYRLKTKDNKEYKVRIADNNDFISRENELAIYKSLNFNDFLYYDLKTGNSIRYWIKGRSVTKKDLDFNFLLNLSQKIKDIHNTPISKNNLILQHDDLEFYESTKKFIEEYDCKKYRELVMKYRDCERVLCHNDISLGNLIIDSDTKKIYLIDYEWGRINSKYWDYGNFIKESNLSLSKIRYLSKISNLDLYKLYEYIYISTLYSLQLSFQFPDNKQIISYRNRLFKQLEKYRNWIK